MTTFIQFQRMLILQYVGKEKKTAQLTLEVNIIIDISHDPQNVGRYEIYS
jgi:hypothetical protein